MYGARVWPIDRISQVVSGRLGEQAQQRLEPPELVHALEQRNLAGAGNGYRRVLGIFVLLMLAASKSVHLRIQPRRGCGHH